MGSMIDTSALVVDACGGWLRVVCGGDCVVTTTFTLLLLLFARCFAVDSGQGLVATSVLRIARHQRSVRLRFVLGRAERSRIILATSNSSSSRSAYVGSWLRLLLLLLLARRTLRFGLSVRLVLDRIGRATARQRVLGRSLTVVGSVVAVVDSSLSAARRRLAARLCLCIVQIQIVHVQIVWVEVVRCACSATVCFELTTAGVGVRVAATLPAAKHLVTVATTTVLASTVVVVATAAANSRTSTSTGRPHRRSAVAVPRCGCSSSLSAVKVLLLLLLVLFVLGRLVGLVGEVGLVGLFAARLAERGCVGSIAAAVSRIVITLLLLLLLVRLLSSSSSAATSAATVSASTAARIARRAIIVVVAVAGIVAGAFVVVAIAAAVVVVVSAKWRVTRRAVGHVAATAAAAAAAVILVVSSRLSIGESASWCTAAGVHESAQLLVHLALLHAQLVELAQAVELELDEQLGVGDVLDGADEDEGHLLADVARRRRVRVALDLDARHARLVHYLLDVGAVLADHLAHVVARHNDRLLGELENGARLLHRRLGVAAQLEHGRVLVDLDGRDALDLARLLDVRAVRADRQAHQLLGHVELGHELGALLLPLIALIVAASGVTRNKLIVLQFMFVCVGVGVCWSLTAVSARVFTSICCASSWVRLSRPIF